MRTKRPPPVSWQRAQYARYHLHFSLSEAETSSASDPITGITRERLLFFLQNRCKKVLRSGSGATFHNPSPKKSPSIRFLSLAAVLVYSSLSRPVTISYYYSQFHKFCQIISWTLFPRSCLHREICHIVKLHKPYLVSGSPSSILFPYILLFPIDYQYTVYCFSP